MTSQEWKRLNPIRYADHQLVYRKRHRPECRYCYSPVPWSNKRGGRSFCSELCRLTKRSEYLKAWRDAIHYSFTKFKEKEGCSRCGYNDYGGSLDYHHTDPSLKERRVFAGRWFVNTHLNAKEMKKCILVCKNCHYEIHEECR